MDLERGYALREIHTARGYKEAVRIRGYTQKYERGERKYTQRGGIYMEYGRIHWVIMQP